MVRSTSQKRCGKCTNRSGCLHCPLLALDFPGNGDDAVREGSPVVAVEYETTDDITAASSPNSEAVSRPQGVEPTQTYLEGLRTQQQLNAARNDNEGKIQPTRALTRRDVRVLPLDGRVAIAGQERWILGNVTELVRSAIAFQGPEGHLATWVEFMVGPLSLLKRPRFLDSALRATSLYNVGRRDSALRPLNHFDPTKQALYEAYHYYNETIRYLSTDLGKAAKDKSSSETLHTTMLLSFYEMFACTTAAAYFPHIQGAAALIRSKGPSRMLLTECDRAILIGFRPTLVSHALLHGQRCFLANAQWLKAAALIHSKKASKSSIQDVVEELHVTFVKLPDVLVDVNDACEHTEQAQAGTERQIVVARALIVLAQLGRMHEDLDGLLQRLIDSIGIDGARPHLAGIGSPQWGSFTPFALTPFANNTVGGCLCFLWMQAILINSRMAALHKAIGGSVLSNEAVDNEDVTELAQAASTLAIDQDAPSSAAEQSRLSVAGLKAQNMRLALSICNSVRRLAETATVPRHLAFELKVAYYALASSPTAQTSALDLLEGIGPSFGAANLTDSAPEKRLELLSSIGYSIQSTFWWHTLLCRRYMPMSSPFICVVSQHLTSTSFLML